MMVVFEEMGAVFKKRLSIGTHGCFPLWWQRTARSDGDRHAVGLA
jgi:hypothetical protein